MGEFTPPRLPRWALPAVALIGFIPAGLGGYYLQANQAARKAVPPRREAAALAMQSGAPTLQSWHTFDCAGKDRPIIAAALQEVYEHRSLRKLGLVQVEEARQRAARFVQDRKDAGRALVETDLRREIDSLIGELAITDRQRKWDATWPPARPTPELGPLAATTLAELRTLAAHDEAHEEAALAAWRERLHEWESGIANQQPPEAE
jgi:hypothetical protein